MKRAMLTWCRTSSGSIHAQEGSPEIQRQLNFGSRGVGVGMPRNSPSQCVSPFAEEVSGYAPDVHPFLAKFHRFGPEIVIFSIFGKFRFSHNFWFPSPNWLSSIPVCSGFIALSYSAFISNLPFMVNLMFCVVSLSVKG